MAKRLTVPPRETIVFSVEASVLLAKKTISVSEAPRSYLKTSDLAALTIM